MPDFPRPGGEAACPVHQDHGHGHAARYLLKMYHKKSFPCKEKYETNSRQNWLKFSIIAMTASDIERCTPS
jgi:hypothetical protein